MASQTAKNFMLEIITAENANQYQSDRRQTFTKQGYAMMSSIQHFMMNIPATSPGSTPSRLCLGNEVIRTEQFSTLRVWCPIHKVILQTTIFGGIL
jgi:hypothetical protein